MRICLFLVSAALGLSEVAKSQRNRASEAKPSPWRFPGANNLENLVACKGSLFQVPMLGETHCCNLGIVVRPVISEILLEAENDLIKRLDTVTLADLMLRVQMRLSNKDLTKEI